MTPPIISRILAAGILSAPIGVLTHTKELQKQAEIADPVAYAMKQKQQLMKTQAEITTDPVAYAMRQKEQLMKTQAEITADPIGYTMRQKQVSTTAITYYLYYPGTFITLGLLVGANELIALALRLSLLKSKSRYSCKSSEAEPS